MKIVVTANGTDLNAPASPVFGRCSTYIFVDTETMAFKAADNPAMSASGGAGIQAAQFVIEQGAQAVLTGNVGPNAFNVFQAANVPIYLLTGGTSGSQRADLPAHRGNGERGCRGLQGRAVAIHRRRQRPGSRWNGHGPRYGYGTWHGHGPRYGARHGPRYGYGPRRLGGNALTTARTSASCLSPRRSHGLETDSR